MHRFPKNFLQIAIILVLCALPIISRGGDSTTLLSQLSILDGRVGIGLDYVFTVDNAELSAVEHPCPYEKSYIAQELHPYLRFTLHKSDESLIELRPGLRLVHIIGGGVAVHPRIQAELASTSHHLLLGHFRPDLHPLFLHLKAESDDWPGADYTFSRGFFGFELLAARTQIPADRTYETIPLAVRLTASYGGLFQISALASALHLAGHDTGGTGYKPPEPSKREFLCYGAVADFSLLRPFTSSEGWLNDIRVNGALAYGLERGVDGGLVWDVGVELRLFNFMSFASNYYSLQGEFVSPLAHDELRGASFYRSKGWSYSQPGAYPDHRYLNFILFGGWEFIGAVSVSGSVEQGYHFEKDDDGMRRLYSYNRFICSFAIRL